VAFFGLGFYAAVRNEAESRRDGAVRTPLSQGDGEISSQTAPVATPPASPGETLARELDAYLRSDAPAPQRFRFEGLHFEKSSSELGFESGPALDAVAAVLRAHPQATIRIEGHTDSRGGREKNERLSEERAAAVAVGLMERGIEPPRVSGVGLGESRPIAPNDSELGREQNRRTELVITGKGSGRG
jgi:outer membrane protein OmpA-like peptidoglycan-associated protein